MQPGRKGLKAAVAATAVANVVVAVALVVVTRNNDRGVEVSTASRGASPTVPPTTPPATTPAVTVESSSSSSSSSSSTTTSRPAPTTTTTRRPTTTTTAPPSTTTTTRPAWEEVSAADANGVYVASSDGHKLRRLAQDGMVVGWSPDGRHLAYLRSQEIWVADLDGASRKVADHFDDAWVMPSWSPDSRHIAFPGPGSDSQRDIWIADARGIEPAVQVPAPGDDAAVAYGPDGRIASVNAQGLSISDADGSHRTLVWATGQLGSPGPILWSPDGTTLAIFPTAAGYWALVGKDGTDPRIFKGRGLPRAHFLPTGRALVSGSYDQQGVPGIYTVPLDGSPWSLIAQNFDNAVPSPGGDRVAATAIDSRGRLASVDVMALDGTGGHVVAALPSGSVWDGLDWSPDGAWLAFGVGVLPTPAMGG